MITNQPIDEQIRSILDTAAFDDLSRQHVLAEVLRLLKPMRGTDLAPNIKVGGGGDLAENIKVGGGGDLAENIKIGGGGDLADNIKVGGGGDLGLTESALDMAALLELVRAGAALGQAKGIVADLREVLPKLHGEERARVEKAVNFLETALGTIGEGYRNYAQATTTVTAAMRRRASTPSGRAVHVHLHLGA